MAACFSNDGRTVATSIDGPHPENGKRWHGSPGDIENWHDAQAAINEIILDGGAAFWHFERLIKTRRDDWTLPARYCAALHRYGIEPGCTEQWRRARELA